MIRDEMKAKLAELMGWRVVSRNGDDVPTCWINERYEGDPVTGSTCQVTNHPIPETLDFIAGALPEGWRWSRMSCQRIGNDGGWASFAHHPQAVVAVRGDAFNEYDARLACVIAAYESERRRA